MSDFLQQKGLGLSLSGLRIGPLDPKSKVPKVGARQQYQVEDPSQLKKPMFLNKERSGFSGGFKIPEEQRRARLNRKIKHYDGEDSEDHEEINKNEITKDEIMQHLNLGSSQAASLGKHGTGSKTALTKDLIENLEKELEKLKRTEENIKVRKHIALKGDRSILDETEDDRKRARDQAIEEDMKLQGNNVIHADQKRIQVMRHRVGQLDSVKNVPYEELEAMRTQTADRLKELEELYWGSKMGSTQSSAPNREKQPITPVPAKSSTPGILKKAPSASESLAKPKFDYRNLAKSGGPSGGGASKSRSRSKKRASSPPVEIVSDPRQQIYEAKYEKYLANKKAKKDQDLRKSSMKKEDFDIWTKGPGSPSKMTKRYKAFQDPAATQLSGKYDAEDLINEDQDRKIILQAELQQRKKAGGDPFHNLGVSSADKMTFFLLKWVFNAIKRDSSDEDPTFQGNPYISKSDLGKQLSKNPELMQALGYTDARQLSDNVKLAASRKDGYLMWSEFLDFFFLKNTNVHDRIEGSDWWNQLDSKGQQIVKEIQEEEAFAEEEAERNKENQDNTNGQINMSNISATSYKAAADKRPIKETASLRMLQASRASRTEYEVEEEFKQIAADKKAASKAGIVAPKTAKKVEYDSLETDLAGEGFGFSREKSKNLLLNSQIEVMREVFERLDKYNEGILRRSDFVMSLRTDQRVIDFIDCEAVKKAYSNTTLTLDSVLLEIEKDERYDQAQQQNVSDQINHKEFLTWREFLNYFNDYQEIEQRNKKHQQMQQTQKSLKKDTSGTADPEADAANEIKTLMEQEKERRLQELPRLRPADQIDISEKQLQLIKDIFDSVPRAAGGKDNVNVLSFFLTIRKDPQIRAINSAIARDPEGFSRVPRETFQEVFDRMERELQQKQVDWSTIVEFFTKRGRPLSKDEIQKLIDEDRRDREHQEAQQRAEEEAERRRNQRIIGDLAEEDDYEAFEMRQKAQQVGKSHQQEDFDKMHGSPGQVDDEEDSYGGEDIERDEDDFDGNQTTKESDMGETLSRVRVTQQEYQKRSQSAKAKKKGKYGVTVPKPFAFDMRDKTKTKSIRERKIEEMVMEKQIEEKNLIKHQFRSKPIPPEVLIPRYQTIMEADQARRQAVRSQSVQLTRQREAPFKFWEKEKERLARKAEPIDNTPAEMLRKPFKANPIPDACSVLIFDKMQEDERQKRRERISVNAEKAFAKAAMPQSMQKWADKKAKETKKNLEVQYSFKPDIGPRVTGKMLQDKADRFQKELAKKKGQKTSTTPKSPPLSKTSGKILNRSYINEGSQAQVEDKQTAAMRKLAAAAMSQEATSTVNPASTKAVQVSQAKRRAEIQEKKKQAEAELKAEADRRAAQNRLKGTVQGQLKSKFGQSAASVISTKVAEARVAQRQQEKQTKEVLKEAVKKGRSRPYLFEQTAGDQAAASNLAYLKATSKMIGLLQAHGEKPDAYLPQKAKELMEDERLKEQLGHKAKSNLAGL